MSNRDIDMRIMFHISALTIGGAERQLTYLVKGLVERGMNVHVVTLYKGGRFWDKLEQCGKCTLHSLDRKSKWDFTVIPKLIRYIQMHAIDLVQGWMLPCNTFAALAGYATGKTVVIGIRASNVKYRLGGRIYAKGDQIVSWLIAKTVIYNSYAGRDYYLWKGHPKGKAVVIPNGLPIPRDKTFPEPFHHDAPWKIGMIARLHPMKDHVTMFDALRTLLQQKAPVELHLYGDGEDYWKQHLENEAQRLGVDSHIYWHGFIDDVWCALAQIDILSSSSSYGEGMSNTLLEAMMAGRAVVATDVGDARMMLRGPAGRCGWIVPARDAQALADTIAAIISKPSDAVRMGKNARKIVIREHSVDAMVEHYVSLFTSFSWN